MLDGLLLFRGALSRVFHNWLPLLGVPGFLLGAAEPKASIIVEQTKEVTWVNVRLSGGIAWSCSQLTVWTVGHS